MSDDVTDLLLDWDGRQTAEEMTKHRPDLTAEVAEALASLFEHPPLAVDL